MILGKLLSDKLLEQLNVETKYQQSIAVFYQGRLIATNLPEARKASWQPPSPQDPPTRLTILRRSHTVKSAALSETGNQLLAVLLHPMAPLEQTELAMSQKLGSFFWVGAILATLAGSLVARMVAQPIVELTRFLRWIAATGDFTTQVPVTSGDEVGELAQAFNFMVDQLAERDGKLNMQVHQLEQALHDLKLTQSQLIQAEKMSSLGMMVAGIAHEINNPVNFIYGNLVRVRFIDNGKGIEPAVIDKLFDPFFTTKPVGKGTGLGLAISYQIVQKHGGDISVNSLPAKGEEFCVSLPIKHAALKAKSF